MKKYLAEFFGTMFLVLLACGSSVLAGSSIGGLGLVNIVGIPVDNCSVNPARSFGPAVFSPNAWPDFWIMVVGPLGGALIAVLMWNLLVNRKGNLE